MLHYEQVFGNVCERGGSKCCAALTKHRHKVTDELLLTLQMAQQLKIKNINVVPGELFCCQCKAKFLWEIDSLYDQDKFQSVTDTDPLNVKHQGKNPNLLGFHLSAYTHLEKLSRSTFQKHTKEKLTVWKI